MTLPKRVSLNLTNIKPNTLIVIKGPTASGKSLLLKTILGEYSESKVVESNDIAYVG